MAGTRCFAVTGDPGVGKTTLIKKVVEILRHNAVPTYGFYTEEIRFNGVRQGFDVVSVRGHRAMLAREPNDSNTHLALKIGKYKVYLNEFERIAIPTIEFDDCKCLLVIDEVGRMELYSEKFKDRITKVIKGTGSALILTSLPSKCSHTIVHDIREHPQTKNYMVTKDNRNRLPSMICDDIIAAFRNKV